MHICLGIVKFRLLAAILSENFPAIAQKWKNSLQGIGKIFFKCVMLASNLWKTEPQYAAVCYSSVWWPSTWAPQLKSARATLSSGLLAGACKASSAYRDNFTVAWQCYHCFGSSFAWLQEKCLLSLFNKRASARSSSPKSQSQFANWFKVFTGLLSPSITINLQIKLQKNVQQKGKEKENTLAAAHDEGSSTVFNSNSRSS